MSNHLTNQTNLFCQALIERLDKAIINPTKNKIQVSQSFFNQLVERRERNGYKLVNGQWVKQIQFIKGKN